MSYTHNRGYSATESGFAIGVKGSEVQIFTGVGGLVQSGATQTTGILQSGTFSAAGISQTGTFGTYGLNMAGTYSGHMIYLHPTSLATGKRVIRIGDYGGEVSIVAGDGIYREYVKVASGTDATSVDFKWYIAGSNAPVWGTQSQVESQAPTTGPTTVTVEAFYAGIADTKFLGASTLVTDGLIATHHKVYGSSGSTCSGNVAAIFLDNQMSCAVAGTEASIKASTGGTIPDGFVWFNTTSSGWNSMFYFDSTFSTSVKPLSALACASTTNNSDASIIVNVNGTLYYIGLWNASHVA